MKIKNLTLFGAAALILTACGQTSVKTDENNSDNEEEKMEKFEYLSEQFSDIKIIRYKIGGFDELTVQQKELVYYLYQVSLSGRDIIYDQNYKYNLVIRKALENVVSNYKGDKESEDWKNLMVYTKRVWFSNGIHHHYSTAKLKPECSKEFFNKVLAETNTTLENGIVEIMFDNVSDMKRVNLDPEKDLIAGSANNFYGEGITQAEVEAFYAAKIWKVGGKYSASIEQMVFWLKKAATVAESEDQKKGFELLIKYYETGDLKIWDEYNILWAKTTGDVIDYINGFIEVYINELT